MTTHPLKNTPDTTPALGAAWAGGIGIWILVTAALYLCYPPTGWYGRGDALFTLDMTELLKLIPNTWLFSPPVSSIGSYAKMILALVSWPFEYLAERGVIAAFLIYSGTAIVAAIACSLIVYRSAKKGLPPVRRVTTVSGSEPRYGRYGATHIRETWCDREAAQGRGIFLAPGLVMPRDVETEHLAVIGTTGAGKSTIIDGILLQAIKRGDRAIIVDVKGDAIKRFNSPEALEIAINSKGGKVWRIGFDIRSRQDAAELAAILIPASKDPMWSEGARLYVTGLLVALLTKRRTNWGWRELQSYIAKPFSEQEQIIRRYMPDVVHLMHKKDGDPTATVMSILITVTASVGALAWTLAEAEQRNGRGISLRSWAIGKTKTRVIFLRLEYDRESQSAALLKLALRCIQTTLLSNEVENEIDHAIWIGLDELPRFCDETTIERLVALGRSRGIRIAAALQLPAQLRKTIGADATTSLLGNFGIQIISRIAPGVGRPEIARDWFGTRTVTWNPALTGGDTTKDWPTKDIPVLAENELSSALGKFYSSLGRPFIRAAITGFEHTPILDWPVGWASRL